MIRRPSRRNTRTSVRPNGFASKKMGITVDALKTGGKLREDFQFAFLVPLLLHVIIAGFCMNDSDRFESNFHGSRFSPDLLFGRMSLFVVAVGSRLDAAGHSGRYTQARQHPTHQHDIGREKCHEPQPIRHKFFLLFAQFFVFLYFKVFLVKDQSDIEAAARSDSHFVFRHTPCPFFQATPGYGNATQDWSSDCRRSLESPSDWRLSSS